MAKSKTQKKWSNRPLNGCRFVKGKRETCCINPKRGYWCWSKRFPKNTTRKMTKECCRK